MDDIEKTDQFLLAALIDLTMLIAGETKAVVTEVLTKMGLTGPQANAVWQLDPNAAAPSMREFALKLRCDPSTITSMADGLEMKKLITRRVDPHNRRVKIICLSAKGRLIRQKLVDTLTTRSPVARLSKDEKQQLYTLLSKVVRPNLTHGDW